MKRLFIGRFAASPPVKLNYLRSSFDLMNLNPVLSLALSVFSAV
jgi:hypothetical protein